MVLHLNYISSFFLKKRGHAKRNLEIIKLVDIQTFMMHHDLYGRMVWMVAWAHDAMAWCMFVGVRLRVLGRIFCIPGILHHASASKFRVGTTYIQKWLQYWTSVWKFFIDGTLQVLLDKRVYNTKKIFFRPEASGMHHPNSNNEYSNLNKFCNF